MEEYTMIEYKIKKLLAIEAAAIIPLIALMGMVLFGINILFALMFTMFIAIIIGFISSIITSQNAWVQAIEGKNMLCIDLNSSGIVKLFNVEVNVPDIKLNTDKGSEKRIYDRMISFVLKNPEQKMSVYENDKEDNLEFKMPRKDFQKSLFKAGYLNFLVYNSQTGMFLTKEFLAQSEKELMIEYVTLNEWKELKELNKIMRDFTRQTMDTINNSLMGIIDSPIFKIIALLMIILIVGAIGFAFLDIMGIDIFGGVVNVIPTPKVSSVSTPIALTRFF
jgi:hypothetical protein